MSLLYTSRPTTSSASDDVADDVADDMDNPEDFFIASKASNASSGFPARVAASMSRTKVLLLGAMAPSATMTWYISNACSALGCGAVAHASSSELYVLFRGLKPSDRILAKTSSAASAMPPALTAASVVSYVSRLGSTPALTISAKLLATKSGCFARLAATMSELNAAGGGATFLPSISSKSLHVRTSRGFGPLRLPTSVLANRLSNTAYVRGVMLCPERSMSSLTLSASATRLARTAHSIAKSYVLRDTFTPLAAAASYTSMARPGPTDGLFLHASITATYVDSVGSIPAAVISRTAESTASIESHRRTTSLHRPTISGALTPAGLLVVVGVPSSTSIVPMKTAPPSPPSPSSLISSSSSLISSSTSSSTEPSSPTGSSSDASSSDSLSGSDSDSGSGARLPFLPLTLAAGAFLLGAIVPVDTRLHFSGGVRG
mmetsp:Transcript_6395/g.24754  ORF Transcript_6395/g.24754 Transcript_6395/m.24754 type:complete len:434 (-) Transcript_6395:3-1304(-)